MMNQYNIITKTKAKSFFLKMDFGSDLSNTLLVGDKPIYREKEITILQIFNLSYPKIIMEVIYKEDE